VTLDLDAIEAAARREPQGPTSFLDSQGRWLGSVDRDTVLALVAEVRRLREALLESPAMAEMLRAAPGALRFRDAELDALRAGLRECLGHYREAADDAGPIREPDRNGRIEALTKLAQG
jgi:hypothetical protein